MGRNWLAGAALAAVAISVPVTAITGTAQAATLSGQLKTARASAAEAPKKVLKKAPMKVLKRVTTKAPLTWNEVAAALAIGLVGDPYSFGGTSPAGFDCSGLTQFVYLHAGHGKRIGRTAEDQFLQFRRISHSRALPGDLVFFHETSDPSSHVYHVGVFEGGDDMVAATTYGQGVQFQSFTWGGDTVTFGTITD